MQRLSPFVPVVLLICLQAPTSPASAHAADRPNVIVVMTDDQGYGDLSCHGNSVVQTPHLDQLAAESVRFVDFHVAPMCTPTRGQLLTGVDALRNKAMNVSSGRSLLRRDLPTMADLFQSNGYATGIFGKWHLGDSYPYRPQDRGFQHAIWFPSSHVGSVPDAWNNDYFDDVYLDGDEPREFSGYCTDVFFTQAIDWMAAGQRQKEPFFAYLALNAPHAPHYVAERYRQIIADRLDGAAPLLPALTMEQRQALVSFLAMIVNIDENMGRLEDFLREHGLRDDTIVLFLTDNGSTLGPQYFNAGMRGGKSTLWEGGHRVPCFIRWPNGGLRSAGEVDELTQVQDLLPTLVDLCKLKTPSQLAVDGVSLAPLLQNSAESFPDRTLVVHYSRMPGGAMRPSPENASIPRRDGAAVLWNKWRLLNNKRLFNVESDPQQQRDVAAVYPEIVAKLRADYADWWRGVEADVNLPERVVIGAEAENPCVLTCCEWYDVIVDQQRQVRAGDGRNGVWYIDVAEAGDYEFELRRWPREANLPLAAEAPSTAVTDGRLPAGVALPITAAALRIGDQTQRQPVAAGKSDATFHLPLPAGKTEMQTYFFDASGRELCGAYYIYVNRK